MIYINRLIKKYRENNCSEEELNDLMDLFKIPNYEEAANTSMYLHWKECDNSEIGDKERFKHILSEIHHTINTNTKKTTNFRQLYFNFSRVAAILLLPMIVGFYLLGLYQNTSKQSVAQNTISVPLGARSQFVLPDGTKVMLNSGSSLTYPVNFAHQPNRTISLNGEGFFEVYKNKKSPFIIRMNGVDIKVTGTTFNARAYNDESEIVVALAEGSVLLGDQLPNNTFDLQNSLKPMDVAVFNKKNKKIELFQNSDLSKYLAWTKGLMIFDNDPIGTVVDKLEKLYNVKAIIQDKELLNYRLTATFTNEPLEQALRIISLSSQINYQIVAEDKDVMGVFGKRTLILKKRHK
jgi:transmembrane sensor